jgi:hypothetical protein
MMFFLNTYGAIINIIIGIISICVAIIGVYYGKMAYITADKIFSKGIQIDQDKVCSQVCLEFVIGFIDPYYEFKTATNKIWSEDCNIEDQNIVHIRDSLRSYSFEANFSYYEQHKGEIWDALSKYDEKQADAFNIIREFVEKAKNFNKGMNKFIGSLDDFICPNQTTPPRTSARMEDFFQERQDVNRDKFNSGRTMMKNVDDSLEKLNTILDIESIRIKLKLH